MYSFPFTLGVAERFRDNLETKLTELSEVELPFSLSRFLRDRFLQLGGEDYPLAAIFVIFLAISLFFETVRAAIMHMAKKKDTKELNILEMK